MNVSDRTHRLIQVGAVGLTFVAVFSGLLVLWRHMTAVKEAQSSASVASTSSPPAPRTQQPPPTPVLPLTERPPAESDPFRYFDPKKALARTKAKLEIEGNPREDFGTIDFVAWANDRLSWDYVSGTAETTYDQAMKDIERQRGARGCFKGQVVEIEKAAFSWEGGMMLPGERVLRFLAVHESGNIVAGDHAWLCGLVTGRIFYSNTSGGQTKGLFVVGMFNIPENHGVNGERPEDFPWTKHAKPDP